VCWLLDPEDEGTMMLQNAGNYLPNCTAEDSRRPESSVHGRIRQTTFFIAWCNYSEQLNLLLR
jgi:hypothetical protein